MNQALCKRHAAHIRRPAGVLPGFAGIDQVPGAVGSICRQIAWRMARTVGVAMSNASVANRGLKP